MTAYILFAIGSLLAALLSIDPTNAPPYAWWGVLAVFLAIPVVAWLESSVKTFAKDFDEITGHTNLNDY